ncbi:MAG: DUF1653 domain-containing protein [Minisyncoccia bacterium]
MDKIKPGIYHHYKSKEKLYKVIGVGRNTENNYEEMVIYQALYNIPEFGGDGVIFVRPLAMFLGNVIVDDKEVPRFTFVREA